MELDTVTLRNKLDWLATLHDAYLCAESLWVIYEGHRPPLGAGKLYKDKRMGTVRKTIPSSSPEDIKAKITVTRLTQIPTVIDKKLNETMSDNSEGAHRRREAEVK